MVRTLPPLTALRAFEAAARNLSFRAAADELNVTHSAVSHQIKALETDLGVKLFNRTTRRVELTSAGQQYFPVLREALDRIGRETEKLRGTRAAGVLTVQVYVTIAMRWLLPRLAAFRRIAPDIEVRLSTTFRDWEYEREGIDVGLVLANRYDSDLHYRILFRGELFPVCSPDLLHGANALRQPEDLARVPLLSVYTAPGHWDRWLRNVGLADLPRDTSLQFDTYILALEAAIAGEGVALTNAPFVGPDLRAGRLVRPFEATVAQEGAWYIVCDDGRQDEPKIKRFSDWLAAQIASDPDIPS